MKLSLPLLAIALFSVGMIACGRASNEIARRSSTTSAITSGRDSEDYADGDGDISHKDDRKILGYGNSASGAEQRVIVALFKRYYSAAVARNGALACSLISLHLVKRILSGYGQSLNRPPRRGETCAMVMSKLFSKRRYVLAIEVAKLKVIGVRVAGKKGFVLLRYETLTPETLYMPIRIGAGVWKLDTLFALALL